MDQETIRLVLDLASSSKDVQELTTKLQAQQTTVRTTADTYEVLERQVGEYEVLERRATQATQVQTTALDALGIALTKDARLYQVVTAEMAALSHSATTMRGDYSRSGGGILGVSYAVQDFTSQLGNSGLGGGLRAIQNNIPMILLGLGMTSGIAGAISVVTVGLGLMYDNWDKIAQLWGSGKTEAETQRMKDLAKATEAAADAADKLAKTLSPERKAAGPGALGRAVTAFGGEAVVKELMDALAVQQGHTGAAGFAQFGGDVNTLRNQARTLMANVNLGNPDAIALLQQLQTRGQVGQVLQGGQTPEEERRIGAERFQREQKQLEAARKKQEQEAREKERNEQQAQTEVNRLRRQQEVAVNRDAEKRVEESRRLARGLGRDQQRQVAEAQRELRAGPQMNRIPQIPQGASPQEAMNVLMDSQARLAADQQAMRDYLMRARQLNAKIRSNATAGLP